MRNKVLEFVKKNSLIKKGDRIIVALSGGADSVSLFHFLLSIRDEYELTLYAFHLNHMIRDGEADRDMNFVKELCERNNVIPYIYKEDICSIAQMRKVSTETAGRDARYGHLDELCKKLDAVCATAHTMSDNAETVIFNIARGTSLKGMSGIPVKRGNIIRPLLCVTREEIEKYCCDEGLSFVTDSTNLEDVYTRNRIRHNVIPVLKDINEDFFTAVQRLTDISRETMRFIDSAAEKEKKRAALSYGYSADVLSSLETAVRHEVIIKILEENDISPEYDMISRIDDAIFSRTSVDISRGFSFTSKQGIVRIVKKGENASIYVPYSEYENVRVYCADEIKKLPVQKRRNLVDTAKIPENAVIRCRQKGDVFRLQRRKISKSLKKLMIEEKIPRERRDGLIVLADNENILYCESLGASEIGQVDSNTEKAVEIY